jgi:integrase
MYVKTLLGIAQHVGVIKDNPSHGFRVEGGTVDAKTARLPFTTDELKTILSKAKTADSVALRWVPLIGLYTGMRLEEIGQLSPGDIKRESYKDAHGKLRETAVIYVTEEGEGQGLKNSTSVRRVPVHRELVRAGFLKYAQSQTGNRLFPELRANAVGRETAQLSKWFSALLRQDCDITDKRKAFHSFRHTFKDVMREHGVAEDVSDALTGHTTGNIARNYGGAFYPLRPLCEALERFEIHGL